MRRKRDYGMNKGWTADAFTMYNDLEEEKSTKCSHCPLQSQVETYLLIKLHC